MPVPMKPNAIARKLRGTVLHFHGAYGWIQTRPGERDVYVYHTNIISWTHTDGDDYKRLYPGEIVEFELFEDEKGPAARNVKVVRGVA